MKGNLAGSEDSKDRCQYIVPRKKRRCRMLVREGNSYCGEHLHLFPYEGPSKSDETKQESTLKHKLPADRMACPNDPMHSCKASKLEKHLLVCPSKPKPKVDYISEGTLMETGPISSSFSSFSILNIKLYKLFQAVQLKKL